MDIQLLHEFVVLSEICNYARAADELFTTQATLSRHIISLEKELGHNLFFRSTRKVELTRFGTDFLEYAKRITDTWDECRSYLLSAAQAPNKVIVALSEPILYSEEVQNTLVGFSLDNPEYDLETIQDDDEDRLIERLRNHDCDFVILREPLSVKDSFIRLPILPAEPVCILLPKEHPLASKDKVSLDSLKDEYLILPPSYSYTYKLVTERCRELGFEPKLRSALRGKGIAAKMVNRGIGMPVLCRRPALRAADSTVKVVEIEPAIMQHIALVYPKLSNRSKAQNALLSCFREMAAVTL